MTKVKVKCGAIVKEISKGTLKWYKEAGWKVIEKKEEKNDKTNTKKTTTT